MMRCVADLTTSAELFDSEEDLNFQDTDEEGKEHVARKAKCVANTNACLHSTHCGTVGSYTPQSEHDSEALEHDILLKLAAPLSKEQLIDLIRKACVIAPEIRVLLYTASISSPASRRLMIRNIHYSTTDESFERLFAQFGELEDAAIVREKTGRSRGFGFVTFASIDTMHTCINASLHLDGRKLFVKVAADPFSQFLSDGVPVQSRSVRRKIFVRNLGQHLTAADLRQHFQKYGVIEDCSVVYSTATKQSKGFAFITYERQDSAVRATAESQQTLANRVVFVTLAKSTTNMDHLPSLATAVADSESSCAVLAQSTMMSDSNFGPCLDAAAVRSSSGGVRCAERTVSRGEVGKELCGLRSVTSDTAISSTSSSYKLLDHCLSIEDENDDYMSVLCRSTEPTRRGGRRREDNLIASVTNYACGLRDDIRY